MKVIVITNITLLLAAFSSCKKGYTCACSSEDGFYDGFDIHGSKRNAEKKCTNYYKSKYQYVEQTDSVQRSLVECELKKGE